MGQAQGKKHITVKGIEESSFTPNLAFEEVTDGACLDLSFWPEDGKACQKKKDKVKIAPLQNSQQLNIKDESNLAGANNRFIEEKVQPEVYQQSQNEQKENLQNFQQSDKIQITNNKLKRLHQFYLDQASVQNEGHPSDKNAGESSSHFFAEYSQEVYLSLLEQEKRQRWQNVFKSKLRPEASTISLMEREIVAKRMVEVCKVNSWKAETVHLAFAYLDKAILIYYPLVNFRQLKLIAFASAFLASKMEEIEIPSLEQIMLSLKNEEVTLITEEMILHTEHVLLKQFDFDLQMVTSLQFLERFLQLTKYKPRQKIYDLSTKLMLGYKIKNPSIEMKSSLQAASCLFKAAGQVWNNDRAKIQEMKREWSYQHAFYTKLSIQQIEEGIKKMELNYHKAQSSGK